MRRLRFTREMRIPKGSIKVTDKQSDCVAYLYERQGAPYAICFSGRADKPDWNYRFRDLPRRDKAITEAFEQRRARLKAKQAERDKRKAWVNPYKVGDLFRRSWGYEQTNIDWYEVTEVSGKMLTVRQIMQERVATGDMTGKTTPLPGQYRKDEKPIRCLAQDGRIKINHYAHAFFVKPDMQGGIAVYGTDSYSTYA